MFIGLPSFIRSPMSETVLSTTSTHAEASNALQLRGQSISTQEPASEKSRLSKISQYFSKRFFRNSEKQGKENEKSAILQSIIIKTEALQQTNEETKNLFNLFESYIENDFHLKNYYYQCLENSKDRLLPKIKIVESTEPFANPIIEAWNKEQHIESYYDSLKTRFRDFFQENLPFYHMLNERLDRSRLSERQWMFWQELTPYSLRDSFVYVEESKENVNLFEVIDECEDEKQK